MRISLGGLGETRHSANSYPLHCLSRGSSYLLPTRATDTRSTPPASHLNDECERSAAERWPAVHAPDKDDEDVGAWRLGVERSGMRREMPDCGRSPSTRWKYGSC